MGVEVVVTSRDCIKPSFPTPQHLLRYPLSFFDQINQRILIPMLYFYPKVPGTHIASPKLKKSLSDVLTKFYPLAGRVREDHAECNDEGVPYFEAQVNCHLSEVVAESCLGKLNKFLPYGHREDAGDVAMAVQVNFFECGGIVIGTSFNHKLLDGVALFYFMNSWALTARGGQAGLITPIFDLSKLFPATRLPSGGRSSREKVVGKRFVFSKSSLFALREKYNNNLDSNQGVNPSRFEALSGFIWCKIANTSQRKADPEQALWAFVMVNLRTKTNPPLSPSYFGNLVGFAMVGSSADPAMMEGSGFVTRTRVAVKRIDDGFVRRIHESNQVNDQSKTKYEATSLMFSSISKFPIYEADFGWGRPAWVTMSNGPFINIVLFLPTGSGEGIEVLCFLKEDDMNRLEADKEWLGFVSNPSDVVLQLRSSL